MAKNKLDHVADMSKSLDDLRQMCMSEDDAMKSAAKAIGALDSEWVWAGISHNAWIDEGQDILPIALLQKDVERQTKWIEEGRFQDYGGLWKNHDEKQVLGRIAFRAIVPGTRMSLEAGPISTEAALKLAGKEWPMSVGYWFTADKSGQYTEFVKYESSVLDGKKPANVLTWFKVYQRAAATSDALTKFAQEKSNECA